MMVDVLQKIKQRLQLKARKRSLWWWFLVFPGRFNRYKLKLIFSYFQYYFLKRSLKSSLEKKRLRRNEVTIVIISAGRKEYLQKTIESMKKYFQYDDKKTKWFIIDDYPESQEARAYIKNLKGFDLKILNEKNMGLGYSLNRIYAKVESEFIFHFEDDWEVLRPISVMRMIELLGQYTVTDQILLYRESFKPNEYRGAQEKAEGYAEYEHIFSFNPHLVKTELFLRFYPFPLYLTEYDFTYKIRKGEYRTSGIFGYGESPYVRHLGAHRSAKIR